MAKKSAVEKNKNRQKLSQRYAKKRSALRAVIRDKSVAPEERLAAVMKLDGLPKNANPKMIRVPTSTDRIAIERR